MRNRTVLASAGIVVALVGGLFLSGALLGSPPAENRPVASPAGRVDPLLAGIAAAQQRLTSNPKDFRTWADLSIGYAQQAKASGDASFYAKAEQAAERSLALDKKTNFLGYAALAAVRNGQHDFAGAKAAAERGIAINSYNSTLYGALGDALTQLGQYDKAAAAVDRMNQLQPGVPAFTRASYVFELRGDVPAARTALLRAVKDAVSPADVAFSQYYLGELELHYAGGADKALAHYEAGLAAVPTDATLLAGRARAQVALGRTDLALADYERSVQALPAPQAVLEHAQLLDSLKDPRAKAQYDLVRIQERLLGAAGVALDAASVLFEADHGQPATALRLAVAGWKTNPFVEMADAHAWALYANKRYAEALPWANKAFASGWRTSPALYHRGMIQHALGNKAAARADLTEALRLDPHFDALKAPKARATLATL